MGCFEEELRPGEEIVRLVRLHWAVFLPPLFWLLAALVFLTGPAAAALAVLPAGRVSAGQLFYDFWADFGLDPYLIAGLFALAMAALGLAWAAARWWWTELAVTGERVLGRRGLLGRTEFGVDLAEAKGASVRRGVTGALLGFGTLRLAGLEVGPLPLRAVLPGEGERAEDAS